jgi:hypothetical protein
MYIYVYENMLKFPEKLRGLGGLSEFSWLNISLFSPTSQLNKKPLLTTLLFPIIPQIFSSFSAGAT